MHPLQKTAWITRQFVVRLDQNVLSRKQVKPLPQKSNVHAHVPAHFNLSQNVMVDPLVKRMDCVGGAIDEHASEWWHYLGVVGAGVELLLLLLL